MLEVVLNEKFCPPWLGMMTFAIEKKLPITSIYLGLLDWLQFSAIVATSFMLINTVGYMCFSLIALMVWFFLYAGIFLYIDEYTLVRRVEDRYREKILSLSNVEEGKPIAVCLLSDVSQAKNSAVVTMCANFSKALKGKYSVRFRFAGDEVVSNSIGPDLSKALGSGASKRIEFLMLIGHGHSSVNGDFIYFETKDNYGKKCTDKSLANIAKGYVVDGGTVFLLSCKQGRTARNAENLNYRNHRQKFVGSDHFVSTKIDFEYDKSNDRLTMDAVVMDKSTQLTP